MFHVISFFSHVNFVQAWNCFYFDLDLEADLDLDFVVDCEFDFEGGDAVLSRLCAAR